MSYIPAYTTDFDPYDILGVTTLSSKSEVESAYRRLCLEHHPDKSLALDAGASEWAAGTDRMATLNKARDAVLLRIRNGPSFYQIPEPPLDSERKRKRDPREAFSRVAENKRMVREEQERQKAKRATRNPGPSPPRSFRAPVTGFVAKPAKPRFVLQPATWFLPKPAPKSTVEEPVATDVELALEALEESDTPAARLELKRAHHNKLSLARVKALRTRDAYKRSEQQCALGAAAFEAAVGDEITDRPTPYNHAQEPRVEYTAVAVRDLLQEQSLQANRVRLLGETREKHCPTRLGDMQWHHRGVFLERMAVLEQDCEAARERLDSLLERGWQRTPVSTGKRKTRDYDSEVTAPPPKRQRVRV